MRRQTSALLWLITVGVFMGILIYAKADELEVTVAPQVVHVPEPARNLVEAFQAGGVKGFLGQIFTGDAVCDTREMSERQLRRFLRNGLPARCRTDYDENIRQRFEAARQQLSRQN